MERKLKQSFIDIILISSFLIICENTFAIGAGGGSNGWRNFRTTVSSTQNTKKSNIVNSSAIERQTFVNELKADLLQSAKTASRGGLRNLTPKTYHPSSKQLFKGETNRVKQEQILKRYVSQNRSKFGGAKVEVKGPLLILDYISNGPGSTVARREMVNFRNDTVNVKEDISVGSSAAGTLIGRDYSQTFKSTKKTAPLSTQGINVKLYNLAAQGGRIARSNGSHAGVAQAATGFIVPSGKFRVQAQLENTFANRRINDVDRLASPARIGVLPAFKAIGKGLSTAGNLTRITKAKPTKLVPRAAVKSRASTTVKKSEKILARTRAANKVNNAQQAVRNSSGANSVVNVAGTATVRHRPVANNTRNFLSRFTRNVKTGFKVTGKSLQELSKNRKFISDNKKAAQRSLDQNKQAIDRDQKKIKDLKKTINKLGNRNKMTLGEAKQADQKTSSLQRRIRVLEANVDKRKIFNKNLSAGIKKLKKTRNQNMSRKPASQTSPLKKPSRFIGIGNKIRGVGAKIASGTNSAIQAGKKFEQGFVRKLDSSIKNNSASIKKDRGNLAKINKQIRQLEARQPNIRNQQEQVKVIGVLKELNDQAKALSGDITSRKALNNSLKKNRNNYKKAKTQGQKQNLQSKTSSLQKRLASLQRKNRNKLSIEQAAKLDKKVANTQARLEKLSRQPENQVNRRPTFNKPNSAVGNVAGINSNVSKPYYIIRVKNPPIKKPTLTRGKKIKNILTNNKLVKGIGRVGSGVKKGASFVGGGIKKGVLGTKGYVGNQLKKQVELVKSVKSGIYQGNKIGKLDRLSNATGVAQLGLTAYQLSQGNTEDKLKAAAKFGVTKAANNLLNPSKAGGVKGGAVGAAITAGSIILGKGTGKDKRRAATKAGANLAANYIPVVGQIKAVLDVVEGVAGCRQTASGRKCKVKELKKVVGSYGSIKRRVGNTFEKSRDDIRNFKSKPGKALAALSGARAVEATFKGAKDAIKDAFGLKKKKSSKQRFQKEIGKLGINNLDTSKLTQFQYKKKGETHVGYKGVRKAFKSGSSSQLNKLSTAQAYKSFLGRNPKKGDLSFYDKIAREKGTAAAVAAIRNSPEAKKIAARQGIQKAARSLKIPKGTLGKKDKLGVRTVSGGNPNVRFQNGKFRLSYEKGNSIGDKCARSTQEATLACYAKKAGNRGGGSRSAPPLDPNIRRVNGKYQLSNEQAAKTGDRCARNSQSEVFACFNAKVGRGGTRSRASAPAKRVLPGCRVQAHGSPGASCHHKVNGRRVYGKRDRCGVCDASYKHKSSSRSYSRGRSAAPKAKKAYGKGGASCYYHKNGRKVNSRRATSHPYRCIGAP